VNGMITMGGVTMPIESARLIEWTGIDPADDVAAIRSGEYTRNSLLAMCLDGAGSADEGDWQAYVEAVCVATEVES
jgi:hypothetical protein